MPETEERSNIWYVSNRSRTGFSSDPNQAVRDLTGAPVICPGHTWKMLDRRDQLERKRISAVWELLLDAMEAQEQETNREFSIAHSGEVHALEKALAILELHHDYKTEPEATVQRIREMAEVKYDQSSQS